ncbi:MAG: 2-amino-4-hydroxy-6-hydroxymethyldihydropteridine diphosphokinase [Pseudomonadota bacterium]
MTSRPHWFPAYVGVGSNLDSPAKQVEAAFGRLDDIRDTRLFARSALYRSAPYGGVEQPDFINAVAGILTCLSPEDLLDEMQAVQRQCGRDSDEVRWGPRIIDLDLLAYSSVVFESDTLTIPHPGIAERNFVLLPFAEIAPDLIIPGLGHLASIEVNRQEPAISRIG